LLGVIVKRSAFQFVPASRQWRADLQQYNLGVSKAVAETQAIWICEKCQMDTVDHPGPTISVQALQCCAVVRRLGMEEAHLAFLEETAPLEGKDGWNVSLRRLDEMLRIIAFQPSQDDVIFDEWKRLHDILFSKAIDWIPVDADTKPRDLLCAGIERLVDLSIVTGRGTGVICSFLREFLSLFTGCCLLSGTGHPASPHFLTPFYLTSCRNCLVRPGGQPGLLCGQCSTPTVQCHLASALDLAILQQYDEAASLVGSVVLFHRDDLVLSQCCRYPFEAWQKPIEMIVVSFRLRDVHSPRFDAKTAVTEGLFHLVPVYNQAQLHSILSKCKSHGDVGQNWKDEGFVQMNFADLKIRIADSKSIFEATQREVVKFVSGRGASAQSVVSMAS
jgi:hypothetical protein